MSFQKADIICQTEYKSLDPNSPSIGLLMMVKNEEKNIKVSLQSVLGQDGEQWVDAVIIYDTGSTDSTMDIIKDFCSEHKINLYMIKGEFVDFSSSRNVSLDFAETVNVHYLLLLDCNDQLRGGLQLREYAKQQFEEETSAWLVCQQWWSGRMDMYFNVRFIRNRRGWRYQGRVHEWIRDTTVEGPNPRHAIVRMPENIVIFQDRTKDDGKTGKRFSRDYTLLLQDHKDNPKEPRTLFYLAQTCQCLGKFDEALYYSKLRLEINTGFNEEVFHSYIRCGDCAQKLGHSWDDIIPWYLKAFAHSERAEPLVKIAKYYNSQNNWHMAYLFARRAVELSYPTECILFVDRDTYDYERWHILGICSFYIGEYKIGKDACIEAIRARGKEIDRNNLQFYLDKEEEKLEKKPNKTKKEFMTCKMRELRKNNPSLTKRQIERQALLLWKKEKEK